MDTDELNQKHENIATQIIQILRDSKCSIRDVEDIMRHIRRTIETQTIV